MYSLKKFLASDYSVVIYHGDEIAFCSKASDLKPLVRYLATTFADPGDITIFDKYVGRAAALLMVRIKPAKVYTGIISKAGSLALDEHAIPYEAGKKVEYLMGVASEGMCRWEKMSMGKTPEDLWKELQVVYHDILND